MISLEHTEKIKALSNLIKKESLKYPGCSAVYLFGSFLQKECSEDIDVLIVYNDSGCDVNSQMDELSIFIEKVSGFPVDMTALSENEMKETSFLDRLNYIYIRVV